MSTFRIQTRFPHADGDPADAMINTLHFEGDDNETDNAFDMIEDFFNDTYAGGEVAAWISDDVVGSAVVSTAYKLEDSEPRAPFATREWTLANAGAGAGLPPQVALVMSFQASKVSGQPQARRRNRIYIPGIKTTGVSGGGLVTSALQDQVAASATGMLDASAASINMKWVVYSPTLAAAGSGPGDGTLDIADGWVDNSFDIQRRRKVNATVRDTFTYT